MNLPVIFCTTCRGRLHHFKETFIQNLRDNPEENIYFLILDYNSEDGLKEFILENFTTELQNKRITVYNYPNAQKFKMAHAKNMAHRLGMQHLKLLGFRDGILVNLDADNFTGTGFGMYLRSILDKPFKYAWSRMIKHSGMPRGISGRIAMRFNAFLMSGGYDEARFNEWGPDDKDITQRLTKLGFEGVEVDKKYLLALNHTDKMRFKEYPGCQALTHEYYEEVLKEDRFTVANFGRCGMGVVVKNYESEEIHICPTPIPTMVPKYELINRFPTRVFNIGFQKTATTSFAKAMSILGYNSAHWENAHWAKAIWREMNTLGHSPTLEKHYSLADFPIAIMYDRLDKAYPGSKFILTVRDEIEWLTSVEAHWDANKNPFRSGWDSDPFSNRIHQIVYKRQDFHAETFLQRYRKHNEDVIGYFKSREQDLLVMNMSKGHGWNELCAFLGEDNVPTEQYPRAFASY